MPKLRSRAVCRRHCVGGGAPVNFGQQRHTASSKQSAVARHWRPKNFSKIPEKISFYPQNFLMTFFSHRKLQQNKYTATMASLARQQIIGGGAPINQNRQRRRPKNCQLSLYSARYCNEYPLVL